MSMGMVICFMNKSSRLVVVIFILIFAITCGTVILTSQPLNISRDLQNTLLSLSIAINILLLVLHIFFFQQRLVAANRASLYQNQAYTDAMTQVNNRAAFNLVVNHLTVTAYPRLTLIMTDLNNLKQVNDTLGHTVGDKLICALVNCLERAFGQMGKIYRYGGDEFVILIEDASIEDVESARMHFDKLILDHNQHMYGGFEIFVAVGMASRLDQKNANLHVSELLLLADVAMYQYKTSQKAANVVTQPTRRQGTERIDALTGILTYSAFKSLVHDSLSLETTSTPFIINFKLNFYNGYTRLFGWEASNQLLQKLATLALSFCGNKGFCAHGEADSFWVFADQPDIDTLIASIKDMTERFQKQLGDFPLFPSFGIYCVSDRRIPVSDMCSRASEACRSAKGRLNAPINVYNPDEVLQRFNVMQPFPYMQWKADSDEFVPYYQARFSQSGKLLGMDAAPYWLQTDGRLFCPPDRLTALYEDSGLILPLNWHILEKVCETLREQLDAGLPCVPVSVAFSRLHVYESNCAERICKLADQYHLPHHLLEIEFSSALASHDAAQFSALLSSIRNNGFAVSLNGLGDLLSSISLFKGIPVNSIRLDCAPFTDSAARDLLSHAVQITHDLGAAAIAAGVQSVQQHVLLCECNFDALQGTFLSPHMSKAEFEQLLQSQQLS